MLKGENIDYSILATSHSVAFTNQSVIDLGVRGMCLPLGASAVGGMYVTALMYREPARRTLSGVKRGPAEDRCQHIAVESREAERMSSLVGEHNARTSNDYQSRSSLIK